jgi:hypothetical protein
MAPPKVCGRQKGTPNKATAAVKEIAGQYNEKAVKMLAAIMNDPQAPHAARVAAAGQLLDRGHGRPSQSMTPYWEKDDAPAPITKSQRYGAIIPRKRISMMRSVTSMPLLAASVPIRRRALKGRCRGICLRQTESSAGNAGVKATLSDHPAA